MTTAQKPQVFAARGGGSSSVTQGGYYTGGHSSSARHGRDMPGHLTLKVRQVGQSAAEEEAQRDRAAVRAELEAKERAHFEQLKRERERTGGRGSYLLSGAVGGGSGSSGGLLLEDAHKGSLRAPTSGGAGAASSGPCEAVDSILAAFNDADDDALERKGYGPGAGSDDDTDSDDADDEDDTAELMKELERIRREREEERARKEREAAALSAKESTEAILRGNPLLTKGLASALGSSGAISGSGGGVDGGAAGSAAVRRRFGDDTVFSNTHAHEPEARKRFINDMIRSDFHRNFLKKFIA